MSLFELAFPVSRTAHARALARLRSHPEAPVDYCFSFPVARWLARHCPGQLVIDWDSLEDTARLDELLALLLFPSEEEYFDSGWVSTREWVDMARAGFDGTDFDWLMAQLTDKRMQRAWTQLYEAAEVPLTWNLADSRYARSRNSMPVEPVVAREGGMRRRPRYPKREIVRPLATIELLDSHRGARLIDVAMASLATRYRETYHFNYANPGEVYLADVGTGVAIAVFGLLPAFRFPLECTMGYLILSNGVPIGYGGSSALFRQVNTGINIFDDFRHSEAAYLWTQVMRVLHELTGCTRFIANAYQFGADNSEALRSGAFWFYYRLGYRPVLPEVRKLAQRESRRRRETPGYRSDRKTLRELASCDLHLVLPGARARDYVDERWFETISMLATATLGKAGGRTRRESSARVLESLARDLGARSELLGGEALAPIIAALDPGSWSLRERQQTRELLRAKGGKLEAAYARRLAKHDKLLISLKKACRKAE